MRACSKPSLPHSVALVCIQLSSSGRVPIAPLNVYTNLCDRHSPCILMNATHKQNMPTHTLASVCVIHTVYSFDYILVSAFIWLLLVYINMHSSHIYTYTYIYKWHTYKDSMHVSSNFFSNGLCAYWFWFQQY